MCIVLAALLYFLLTSADLAADYSGLVVSVFDGDTLDILHKQHPERIRLSGIDCTAIKPSRRHPQWCWGKKSSSRQHGRDRSGRILAEADGTDVNHTLVKNGCAGGIGNMHQGTEELARLRGRHERRSKAYGVVRLMSRRGSGGREPVEGGQSTAGGFS